MATGRHGGNGAALLPRESRTEGWARPRNQPPKCEPHLRGVLQDGVSRPSPHLSAGRSATHPTTLTDAAGLALVILAAAAGTALVLLAAAVFIQALR
jgi:hypothetical protein